MQIDVLLSLAVEHDFQPVLKGITTGQQLRPRRRAIWIRKAMGKPHTLLGEAVEVGRLVRCAAVAGQALHTEVIGEDEDDIGLGHTGGLQRNRECEQKAETKGVHANGIRSLT